MDTQRILDVLPAVYHGLLPPFFAEEVPPETAATCSDCAMIAPTHAGELVRSFSAKTKCCTHYPNFANYLVGGLLRSTGSALAVGRRRVRQRIQKRIRVAPQGILRPQKYSLLQRNTDRGAFGRSEPLICPYYRKDKGTCTVRPFRNATCNTWFCKYNAGRDGMAFWTALCRYLKAAEEALAKYALHELGWEAGRIGDLRGPDRILTIDELDDTPPAEHAYRDLWADWAGREEELYVQTHDVIAALGPEDFERITGFSQTLTLEELERRHKDVLSPTLPTTLKRNPRLWVEKLDEDRYVLSVDPGTDPVDVSERLYRMLDFFDGRRCNEEVLALIQEHGGATPTRELLISLYQFRVLVAT